MSSGRREERRGDTVMGGHGDIEPATLLEAILAHAPMAVIFHDRDLKVVRVNEAFHRLTGHGKEVPGKTPFEVIPEPMLNALGLKEKLSRVLKERAVIGPEEICYQTPDGGTVIFGHQVFPLVGPDGGVEYVVTLLQDLTERKSVAQALKEATERLQEEAEARKALLGMLEDLNETNDNLRRAKKEWEETFDAISDPLFIHDRDFKLIKANQAYAQVAGVPLESLLGRPYYEVFPKADGPLAMCCQALETGEQTVEEIVCPSINKCFNVRFFFIKSADGQHLFSVHIMEDITERKRAEERIAKINACFLGFEADPDKNIALLTALCGDLMEATCALYHRLEKGLLYAAGQWQAPPDFRPVDKPEGHICYDVITRGGDGLLVVRNLPETPYARTDPNVMAYQLQTYIGKAVTCAGAAVGSLCVVYQRDRVPIKAEERVIGILASAIGVEEDRRRVAEALRRSEGTFRAISDSAHDAILMLDSGGRITYWNKAAEQIFGYPEADALGKDAHRLLAPPQYHGAAEAGYRSFGETGQGPVIGKTLELTALRRDGTEFPIELSVAAVRLGTQWYATGILRDTTERKRAEVALRKLSRAVEASPHIVMITDAQGLIEYTNPKFTELTGYTAAEVIGTSAFAFGAQSPEDARRMWEAIRAGREWQGEFSHRKKDGGSYWELTSLSPITDAEGVVTHYVKMAQDITQRKAMETQARRLEQMAAMGQLLGGIAHELKNPLFILTGRLQLLREKLVQGEYDTVGMDLQTIEEAAHRMTGITERFLSFLKPHQPHGERCSVPAVLEQTLEFLSNELMKNRIRVVRAFAPTLPETWSDPRQLREVFLNLMLNAMQAMVEAHGRGTLTVASALVDEWIEIRIQDDGPGIPPAHHAKLFDPFFTTKPQEQGTGLGLWTVRTILMQLRGTVACETQVGQGTTFIVRLPVREPDGQASASNRESRTGTRWSDIGVQAHEKGAGRCP